MMRMKIITPAGEVSVTEIDLKPNPGYHALSDIIEPILQKVRPKAWLEHVNVLHSFDEGGEDIHLDMFVDELGANERLTVNPIATKIYRNAYMSRHPKTDPDDLPAIYGTAILFSERVWS